jgi:hypothetical protein
MKNYIFQFYFTFALISFSPLTWSQLNVTVSASAASICTGQTTTLTATPSTGGGTYLWTPGNYTTQTINVSPTATVNYSVTYTLFGNSATSAATLITVNSTPTLNLAGPTQICTAQTACLTASSFTPACSFSWSHGPTTASTCVSPNTNTTYTVTCISPSGCSNTQSTTIQVSISPIMQLNNTNLCQGDSILLSAAVFPTGGTFTWSNGSGQSSIWVSPNATQTFSVQYMVSTCPVIQSSAVVTVYPYPQVSVLDFTICEGGSQALSPLLNPPGGSISWFNQNSNASILVSPALTDTMWIDYTINGCTSRDSFVVAVNAYPNATIGLDGNGLQAYPDSSIYSYSWTLCGSSNPLSTNSNFSGANGSYQVAVSYGSCSNISNCVTLSLGMDELMAFESYPNPCNDVLHVELLTSGRIQMFSLDGQLVLDLVEDAGAITLDLSALAIGTYLLKTNHTNRIIHKI